MFMVVPTWEVFVSMDSASDRVHFRVSENELSSFLKVLAFNKCEFEVRRERNPAQIVMED